MKNELRNLISGKIKVSSGALIQAIACYLKACQKTGEVVKGDKHFQAEEARCLKDYINHNNLWIDDFNASNYIAEGAEQKVYLIDGAHVIKLNDAIFYQYLWEDYLHSLLLHNYFFPDTAYELEGFYEKDGIIYSVVKQPFVVASEKTNLEDVKEFMSANGFRNTRNNDYYNPELGLIIEDLHDENVLTKDGMLYFVDTVFYIKEEFYID